MRLNQLFTESNNWHTDPEQQQMDATRQGRLSREREPAGGDAIDTKLAANNNARQKYAETGRFWLKQKDTQQHINDQPYVGKAAANAAAVELLRQQPDLRGNLVVTAYGPGEQQVTEGKVKELSQDLRDKTMSEEEFKRKYGKTRAEVRAAMREKSVAEGYQVVPDIDRERYTERSGLEGPFHTKSGKVVYYDKQEGKYYDPDSDFYISHEDWEAMNEQGMAEGSDDTIYPNAEVIKSKNGKPVGEIYQDGNYWGAFHYKADRGYDFIDSREEAIEALKDLHQETGRSRPNYTVKGVAEGKEDKIKQLRQDYADKLRWSKEAHDPAQQRQHRMGAGTIANHLKKQYGVDVTQGVAEGLSKRDQKDVAAIKAAIERLESQLKQPNADKDAIQQSIAHERKRLALYKQGVAEGGYSGIDDTDTVGFSVNSERAYNAVMARFGDSIDHDETSGILYVPARMWPNVEMVAFDADGEGAAQTDGSDELAMDEAQYDRGDYYNARSGAEYGRDLNATGNGGTGAGTRRDDILKGQSKNLPADPFSRTTGERPQSDQGKVHRMAQPDEMDEGEKVGNMDADAFDAAMARLKKLAGAGPMKTVWDPQKRVYKNVPTAVQPGNKK